MKNSDILLNCRTISSRKSGARERVYMCVHVCVRVCVVGGGQRREAACYSCEKLGKIQHRGKPKAILATPLLIMKYLNTEN